MRKVLISLTAILLFGCIAQIPDDDVVREPKFPGPQAAGITDAKLDAAAGGAGAMSDRSGINALPAQALFDPAYPKPSFVQRDELANRTPPAEAGSLTGSASVYPTRGQAAESTNSPTLYPPSGQFNTEPGNPSLYPHGPLAPRGFRGQ